MIDQYTVRARFTHGLLVATLCGPGSNKSRQKAVLWMSRCCRGRALSSSSGVKKACETVSPPFSVSTTTSFLITRPSTPLDSSRQSHQYSRFAPGAAAGRSRPPTSARGQTSGNEGYYCTRYEHKMICGRHFRQKKRTNVHELPSKYCILIPMTPGKLSRRDALHTLAIPPTALQANHWRT